MRDFRVNFLEDADDLLQLAHQIGLVVQPPGGVDQQNLGAILPCPFESVIGQPGGIGAGRPGHHRTAGALAPDLQLLDRGGAEGVAGRQHHGFAGLAVLLGELADRRRLAAAIDTDDQDHKGPLIGVNA